MKGATMKSLIEDLKGLIQIESVIDESDMDYPYGKNIDDALNYILELGSKFGLQTKNLDGQVGLIEYGDGEEAVGILVHCDVVPAGTGWETPPFELVKKEGKLFGRGVIDDKGPIIACLHGMKALKDTGIKLNRKIQMIIGTDEETLWRGINRFIEHEKIPELGFTPDGNFPLIYAEKGILDFDLTYQFQSLMLSKDVKLITLNGGMSRNSVCDSCEMKLQCEENVLEIIHEDLINHDFEYDHRSKILTISLKGKSSHAMSPEKGVNVIPLAMRLLSKISCDKVFEEFVDLIDMYGEKIKCDFEDDVSGKLTMNPGLISLKGNVLKINFNIRYPVTDDSNEIVRKVSDSFGGLLRFDLVDHLKPLYVPKSSGIIKTLMKVYQEHTGDYDNEPIAIGGGTYARVLSNVVSFGPVMPNQEELAHEANEYIEERSLYELVSIYKDAMIALSELKL